MDPRWVVRRETTARPQASVIPKDVTWILDRTKTIDPVARTVESEASGR